MLNVLLIFFGKFFSFVIKHLNLGNGSTWPGHIALKLNPSFIQDLINRSKIKTIIIIGTNGKTTTAKLIKTILEMDNKKVMNNPSGANLLNGVASSIILNSSLSGKLDYDFAIFEVDENSFPPLAKLAAPEYVIALNLFRDQLDRYGEIDTIAKSWKEAYSNLSGTTFILNADDPQIAYLGYGTKAKSIYFGLNNKKLEHKSHQHASDSIICPKCKSNLTFDGYYFSHLGKWKCQNCGLKRPSLSIDTFPYYPISGTYMMYDILASVLFARTVKVAENTIVKAVQSFKPAFGRQEEINIDGINVKFFLSKNPTSFNESLRTIKKLNAKNLLILLNDRIPDGTDVSWIWDIDFEEFIKKGMNITLSGDRVYDLALRFKYTQPTQKSEFGNQNFDTNIGIFETLSDAIQNSIYRTKKEDTLYILPTYSAMLEARKILTGKKIL